MDELKYTDLSMFLGTVDLHEVQSSKMPTISEIPPATKTGDVVLVNDGE